MKEAKDDLVRYRITKARETIEDARILANANRWNPCVNRWILNSMKSRTGTAAVPPSVTPRVVNYHAMP